MARLHRWQVCVGLGVAACSFAPRGQDPDALAGDPDIGYASGAVPSVAARRYLQYQLRFVTDGDHEPAVERVQLDYQTR